MIHVLPVFHRSLRNMQYLWTRWSEFTKRAKKGEWVRLLSHCGVGSCKEAFPLKTVLVFGLPQGSGEHG